MAAVLVGYFVHRFGGVAFTQDILTNYLVAAGAMAGGTIAIVFTISTFLLQNASDLYSSQYFEVYVHDWREKFVYSSVIFITIALFGSGLYIGSLSSISERVSTNIVYCSLVAIGFVFALIDWQYKTVRSKLDPSNAISFLESEGMRFLKRVQYDARQIAGIIRARDNSVSEGMALAAAYNRVLQPDMEKLDTGFSDLQSQQVWVRISGWYPMKVLQYKGLIKARCPLLRRVVAALIGATGYPLKAGHRYTTMVSGL